MRVVVNTLKDLVDALGALTLSPGPGNERGILQKVRFANGGVLVIEVDQRQLGDVISFDTESR